MIDPIIASRLQFALAITVHIIFASLSIGLAPYLVYFTVQEIRTGAERYTRLREFWTKVFAVGFVMGTVTGIPMSFLFGTNFAVFATLAGELVGGPLSFEAKMAFFLEAIFLGVLLFGREQVSDRFYAFSAAMVMVGAWLSAFWILAVNSWMQTPRGHEVITDNGSVTSIELADPMAAFLTPRLPWMYVHMQNAAIVAVTLAVAGVAAYLLKRNPETDVWHQALKVAIAVLLVTSMFQVVHGDMYGRHVAETQPHKFAAMEAQYETEAPADFHLIAFPTTLEGFFDPRAEDLHSIKIPHLTSILAHLDPHAEVTGLEEFEHEAPPVVIVFWSFRIMVGLGFWFVLLGLWGAYRLWQGALRESTRLLDALIASTPLGFVAIITGWYVTEVGRQPWLIQDILETSDAVTPGLTGTQAAISLVGFAVVYAALLSIFCAVMWWLITDERVADAAAGIEG